ASTSLKEKSVSIVERVLVLAVRSPAPSGDCLLANRENEVWCQLIATDIAVTNLRIQLPHFALSLYRDVCRDLLRSYVFCPSDEESSECRNLVGDIGQSQNRIHQKMRFGGWQSVSYVTRRRTTAWMPCFGRSVTAGRNSTDRLGTRSR